MKQMLKILKKYTFAIILVIILLLVQAYCDLALPDYTSNIINIGIQENGIESAVPEVLKEDSMNKILIFIDEGIQANILDKYQFIEQRNTEYEKLYPSIRDNNLYILKKGISKEDVNELKSNIIVPITMVYTFDKADLNTLSSMQNENTEQINKYMVNLPEGTTILQVLSGMDKENILKIKEQFVSKYTELGESFLEQTAIEFIKQEYKIIGIDLNAIQMNYLVKAGLKMMGFAAIIMIITILISFISSIISANYTAILREKVVTKIINFSSKEFKNFSASSLITRSTNDIQQIQVLILMLLRMVFYAPIIGIGALSKVVGTSMVWVIGIAIFIILIFFIIMLIIVMPKFQKIQKLIDKVNMISREILTGLPVIRAFSTEKHEEERFDNANIELTDTQLFTRKALALLSPFLTILMNVTMIGIIWIGSIGVDQGNFQVGNLTALLTYTMQIIMSFLMLSMISIVAPRAIVSIKRISEILDKEISIKDPKTQVSLDSNKKGIVEFNNVSFKYPDSDEYVLENISFTATPGTTTAIIGSTGSGKSTLVNLIPRFYDVTEGKIIVEGANIKDISLSNLRQKIGFVPQKGLLFSGTIESNIKFGNEEMLDDDMKKAAYISCAKEFIENKEDKYKSSISQGGNNVSGGQRQRLAIARAIAINPDIYIFDDSFSALDYKTDNELRKHLSEQTSNKTIFIVAQRISTIMNADQIIVLDEGKVVGIGTHKELLEKCTVYKDIALSQLRKEELENGK